MSISFQERREHGQTRKEFALGAGKAMVVLDANQRAKLLRFFHHDRKVARESQLVLADGAEKNIILLRRTEVGVLYFSSDHNHRFFERPVDRDEERWLSEMTSRIMLEFS